MQTHPLLRRHTKGQRISRISSLPETLEPEEIIGNWGITKTGHQRIGGHEEISRIFLFFYFFINRCRGEMTMTEMIVTMRDTRSWMRQWLSVGLATFSVLCRPLGGGKKWHCIHFVLLSIVLAFSGWTLWGPPAICNSSLTNAFHRIKRLCVTGSFLLSVSLAATRCLPRRISISRQWVLLYKECIMAQNVPIITVQNITF